MFITQSLSHSFIAAIIVGRAIKAWRIQDPIHKQRFLFLVLTIPLVSFPAYQLINPARKTISFRMEALFDMSRWLSLEFPGKVPVSLLFIIVMIFTAMVFIFQEALPIIRHTYTARNSEVPMTNPENGTIIQELLENLPGEKPEIFILDDDEVSLFSTTGKNASVYLSRGLIEMLTPEELKAALAHEIAHIQRNRSPQLLIIFLFRVLLFFNPVALVEFRRVVQEEEKICDDMAVDITRNPSVLAETLGKLYLDDGRTEAPRRKDLSTLSSTIEERSHKMLIKSRISRLETGRSKNTGGFGLKIVLTAALVIVINYFVV